MKHKTFNKELELEQRLKENQEFNSGSNSFHLANQNQGHNTQKQALGPNTKR